MAVHLSHSLYLRADGLSVSYAHRRVFTDLGFTVAPGQRLGLIGENGVGKSTLLRLLAGADGRADAASAALGDATVSGRLSRPVRTGLLAQELPFRPDDRVGDVLEAALAEVRAIERELDVAAAELAVDTADERAAAASAARYSAALDAAERADVWSADSRRDEVLEGLGVAGLGLDRRIDEVSGGQRTRFALAALLLGAPDALLLDEPTNHLDDDATAFLEERLRAWRGPVLFASHDREFLDRVATGLLDLDPGRRRRAGARRVACRRGDVARRRARGIRRHRLRRRLQRVPRRQGRGARSLADVSTRTSRTNCARLRASVAETARNVSHGRAATDNDKFLKHFKRGNVEQAVSRRVRNAEHRLETLEREQVRKPPTPLAFAGIPSGSHALEEASGLLLQATDVVGRGAARTRRARGGSAHAAARHGRERRGQVDAARRARGHAARRSRGRASAQGAAGAAARAGRALRRSGCLAARACTSACSASGGPSRCRCRASGSSPPRDESRPVGSLSVGQQRRLALALVIARPPHVFLLDEPTNHLSLALATDLEEALGTYPGAVVIASHDRWLRRRWTGERLELAAGRAVALVE